MKNFSIYEEVFKSGDGDFIEMSNNVDKIYVYGEKDTTSRSHRNIEFIYLRPNHKLIRGWF